jgi:hypothetical protein
MSFTTRSVPLDSVTEIYLEAIKGDDEIYYLTAKIFNQTTEAYDILDLDDVSRIEFSIKNPVSGTIEYTTDNLTGNITVTDANAGTFTIEIPNASSDDLTIGELRYDVQITMVTGSKKRTIVRGPIQIVDDVTP